MRPAGDHDGPVLAPPGPVEGPRKLASGRRAHRRHRDVGLLALLRSDVGGRGLDVIVRELEPPLEVPGIDDVLELWALGVGVDLLHGDLLVARERNDPTHQYFTFNKARVACLHVATPPHRCN